MDFAREVGRLLERLEAAGIEYMVVGALAVDAHGMSRMTGDADIQVATEGPPAGASTFMGCIIEEDVTESVFGQRVLVLHQPTAAIPIEVFMTGHWFTRQALARRASAWCDPLGGHVPLPTAEDLILLKAAYLMSTTRRRRKRIQDGADIESVIEANPDLDMDYIEENAKKLGVWKDLQVVFDDMARS